MGYKLIAIDMDGTFLSDEKAISKENIEAVRAAMDKGVNIIISTGRSGIALKKFFVDLKLDTPFIVYNGAGVKKLDEDDYITRTDLDNDVAEDIYNRGLKLGVSVLVWADDKLYANTTTEFTDFYKFHTGTEFIDFVDFEIFKDKGIHKVLFCDDPNKIREHYSEFVENGYSKANFTISVPQIFEFFNLKSSKGLAVLNYAETLGIKPEEIMCIGDGMNDISMIKMAGLGVAMDNACPELKSVADFVTKSNMENGVAYAIDKFILKK